MDAGCGLPEIVAVTVLLLHPRDPPCSRCLPDGFLKIAAISYTAGTPFDTFYKQLRSAINDGLLREGDRLPYCDNEVLDEDKCYSPTLENVTVLWALQLIDH